MLSNLTGWHFIVILFVVLLLFGAPKLPALARSLGQSAKILKTELRPGDDEATPPAAATAPVASARASAAPASSGPAVPATAASPSTPAVPTPGTPPA